MTLTSKKEGERYIVELVIINLMEEGSGMQLSITGFNFKGET